MSIKIGIKALSLGMLIILLSACKPTAQLKPLIAGRYADNGDGTVKGVESLI